MTRDHRLHIWFLTFMLLGAGCGSSTTTAPQTPEAYVSACLAGGSPGESESKLWAELADWGFGVPEDDASPATPQLAHRVLERAPAAVHGLDSEQAWQSAARYFQAENFHAFEVPACENARARRPQ